MKKFVLLLLLPVIFWGCEKTYDSVINPSQNNTVQVININPIDTLNYTSSDSVLTFAITFNSSQQIQSVYCNIVTPAGVQLNSSAINLYDDGNLSSHGDTTQSDNTYSNKFTMSNSYINGVYIVQYYVNDVFETTNYVSAQNFFFNNGNVKYAPYISDLVAPDSVSLSADTTLYTIQLAVQDSNGLADIETVYFNSYIPPDYHPSSANPIIMLDNGDPQVGDETAGDGIYSVVIIFTGATEGSYRWEFQAVDRGGLYSNKITHYVEVTQ